VLGFADDFFPVNIKSSFAKENTLLKILTGKNNYSAKQHSA